MPLHIVQKVTGSVMVLDVRGRITLGPETEALRLAIREAVAAGYTGIVLDLAGIDYIDSAGLGTLVASFASAKRAGGELKLANLTLRVRSLMQITRLSTVFEVYGSVEEARRSFTLTNQPEARD
jgi:anti-sigma B factor antagonist